MNELQLAAAKKAGIAVLGAVCFILLFKMSPVLAIMLVFLAGVGISSYLFFMDMEQNKIHKAEYEKRMNELARMNKEALDKTYR